MNHTLLARLRDASDYTGHREMATDELWEEHGWALGGRGLAVVILLVLATSILMQMF